MACWCDEGENNVLDCYLKGTARPAFYLGLYINPTSEPAEDATLASLTEPSGNGYGRIQLQDADWTLSGTNPTLATHVQKTFSCSGGAWGNVYGYFICTAGSGTAGKLLAVEQFSDGPYNVPDGGAVKITPKITCA
jgi:hypothetical protein